MLGKRRGFPSQAIPPYNMTLSIMGAGMLWAGWFGFNGGSALAANGGAFMWMLQERINHGKASALAAVISPGAT